METVVIVLFVITFVIFVSVALVISTKRKYQIADTALRRELLREINGIKIRTLRLERPPKFNDGDKVIISNSVGDRVLAIVVGHYYNDTDTTPTYKCRTADGVITDVIEWNATRSIVNKSGMAEALQAPKTSKKK